MSMTQLLFNDEGSITRRQWWIGTITLLALQFAAEIAAQRWLRPRGLDRPALLFTSLALLIPFHTVNSKRFRAIGRSPDLALAGGALAGLSILTSAFAGKPTLDLAFGLCLCGVILWYVVDLGVLDYTPKPDPARVDAAAART